MSQHTVYKFGGASVKDADSVRNVARIIREFAPQPLVVVVSAMAKTTNALEEVVAHYVGGRSKEAIHRLLDIEVFHGDIMDELFHGNGTATRQAVYGLFESLKDFLLLPYDGVYGKAYDHIVAHGEMISTRIVAGFLAKDGIEVTWHDTRQLVHTNNHYRRATVNWDETNASIIEAVGTTGIHLVQGFIGSDENGNTTTLGREGSDYTAAVMAFALNAQEVSIWKDVPGVLNGDPKVFEGVQRLEEISFREAIELAYYGASVIHPKTIQPLQRKEIPLYVRSFLNPSADGTVIKAGLDLKPLLPCFIRKPNQVLITLSTSDLAFIVEDHLATIYRIFHESGVAVNLMQNSAVSTSFCVNNDPVLLPSLIEEFEKNFEVRFNDHMSLYTIRHYNDEAVRQIKSRGDVYLEQITRNTIQFVLSEA